MIEHFIGGFAYLFIIIYTSIRASQSTEPPNTEDIALEMVVPVTIALGFVALLGNLLSEKIENDTQLSIFFGTLFISSIFVSMFQILYSNLRQAKVA